MSKALIIDARAKRLLKTLVERYIADGQPLGSRLLAQASGLDVSAATIRNIMADLETQGLIASPHTSAGRIPTPKGYRLFVDTMLTAELSSVDADNISANLAQHQPQATIASAADILSDLSQYVGVVVAPKRSSVFKHIEFLLLSPRRILLIIVAPDGDVQNRVIHTATDYSATQLLEASNYLNHHYAGQSLETVRQRLATEIDHLRHEISELMHTAVQVGTEQQNSDQATVVVSGESKLFAVSDFAHDLDPLRRAFDLFAQKAQLLSILNSSNAATGIRIFIGGENPVLPHAELSVVASPYRVDGILVGSLAVIGPTRMAYEKMVNIVDITAKQLGNALSKNPQ